ncbi:MAG: hypothetical protein SFU25_01595 [Candidatus Caenarcaniphilales bacterium]|nr:hypothetical protein [Candidatus Caenarcaniphilales bacterium]
MRINEWCRVAHDLAVKKGWHEGPPRDTGTLLMLMVSELAEAMEEDRKGNPPIYQMRRKNYSEPMVTTPHDADFHGLAAIHNNPDLPIPKPEGLAVELADCVIRIFDFCGAHKIDLESAIALKHKYNETRPHRHGGKKY